MKVSDKNRILWEQVRRETDPKEATLLIADFAEQAINEGINDREQLRQEIDKSNKELQSEIAGLRKVLQGNGDPSHSLIARLDRIEENQRKASDSVNKIVWIVVSAVLAQIVLYLLNVL